MYSTIDLNYIRSVPPNFSWDVGPFSDNNTNILSLTTYNGKPLYVGYAPLTNVLVSSGVIDFDPAAAYHVRSLDFGDYFNSVTNHIQISGVSDIFVNHSYVVPGLYSINLSEAEYSNINALTWNEVTTENDPYLVWPEYTGVQASTSGGTTRISNVTALVTPAHTANFYLSVVEILPTAYLSSNIPLVQENIVFPLTVTITPRYTQAGSYPIEKIVWDLGDGSPLITRRRWDGVTLSPFVSTGALYGDIIDPRNFDVVHTYTKPDNSVYSFYPSITAYASSTGSPDACAITIGPIISQPLNSTKKLRLLQTEVNEDGTVIVGQIGSNVGIWKTK